MRISLSLLRLAALGVIACAGTSPRATPAPDAPWCRPGDACWPDRAAWRALGASLEGPLVQPTLPAETPAGDPFQLQDQVGGTESLGWLDAWSAAPSAYAIAARSAGDVARGVSFAREHHVRLVVKGTGHDYLGRSTAPDSLLIWTHELRGVHVDDAFVPHGCQTAPLPAVTVLAGVRWIEAYTEVTHVHHRYVQGGGCTSVGAAGGFLQGGGFGSWSKKYGTAASNLLEAEVVTADGAIVIANACQHADLFWALRGGGGGTFGVVTKATLRTHELPATFGGVSGTITATSDAALLDVLEQIATLYRTKLSNEHWGEQIRVARDAIGVSMVFQGLSQDEAAAAWQPLRDWAATRSDVKVDLHVGAVPGDKMWDYDFLQQVGVPLGGQPPRWWWAGDQGQVAATWAAYQSRWIPLALFDRPRQLATMLFQASRHWSVELHFNKGQAGAAPDAIARGRDTAMNPAVFDAAALLISAAADPGYATDRARAEADRAAVQAAMDVVRAATPGAGSYVNETDYFEPDWQRSFWGDHYDRLLAIKRRYDPAGLFVCHHCVGSDDARAK
jgi:FAD/FMN-containing dehydrogenase